VGPRAILGPAENRKISYSCRELNCDSSVVQVTVLTELYWLQTDIHVIRFKFQSSLSPVTDRGYATP
jgi:hypothetical protein